MWQVDGEQRSKYEERTGRSDLEEVYTCGRALFSLALRKHAILRNRDVLQVR